MRRRQGTTIEKLAKLKASRDNMSECGVPGRTEVRGRGNAIAMPHDALRRVCDRQERSGDAFRPRPRTSVRPGTPAL